MLHKILIHSIIPPLVFILISTAWLISTTNGAKAILATANKLYFKALSVKSISGSIINDLELQGIQYDIKEHGLKLNIESLHMHDLHLPKQNLNLNITIDNKTKIKLNGNIEITKIAKTISGNINLHTDDISWLMKWAPDITRLRGKFNADIKISGNISSLTICTKLDLTNITMTLPNYGIKIKPMEIHLTGSSMEKLEISGKGHMRRGPGVFTISGFIEPLSDSIFHKINIQGKELEFVNTDAYHLIANTNLSLMFLDLNTLYLLGDLHIIKGKVDLAATDKAQVKYSEDVIFTDHRPDKTNENFKIIPNINLRIENPTILKTQDLDAEISGKLKITNTGQKLLGEGRITIKKGTYRLPGQVLKIHYGHLYFPSGTLLTDPTIDIKMVRRKERMKAVSQDDKRAGLYIQGTLSHPIINDDGLITKDQALSQILNVGGGSVMGKIQDKLGLKEFTIESDDSKDPSSLTNKNLVIGKKLSDKTYMQYLKSLADDHGDTVKLRYSINDYLYFGIETNSIGNEKTNYGADFCFSIEKD